MGVWTRDRGRAYTVSSRHLSNQWPAEPPNRRPQQDYGRGAHTRAWGRTAPRAVTMHRVSTHPSLAGRSPCPGGRSRARRTGPGWGLPTHKQLLAAPTTRAEDTLMSSWSPGDGRTAWHEHRARRSEPHQLNLRVLAVRTHGTSVAGPSREPRQIHPGTRQEHLLLPLLTSRCHSPPSFWFDLSPFVVPSKSGDGLGNQGTLPGATGLRL